MWLEVGGASRVLSLEIRAWPRVHTLCVRFPPTLCCPQATKALPLTVQRCAGPLKSPSWRRATERANDK